MKKLIAAGFRCADKTCLYNKHKRCMCHARELKIHENGHCAAKTPRTHENIFKKLPEWFGHKTVHTFNRKDIDATSCMDKRKAEYLIEKIYPTYTRVKYLETNYTRSVPNMDLFNLEMNDRYENHAQKNYRFFSLKAHLEAMNMDSAEAW